MSLGLFAGFARWLRTFGHRDKRTTTRRRVALRRFRKRYDPPRVVPVGNFNDLLARVDVCGDDE